MNTKSSASAPKEKAEIDGLTRLAELLDGVNRRQGKDVLVAIPTKEDERKERKDAAASK
ncbi:hypothetical protein IKF03_03345 [Candidatus Saccharibacteria bacterium]|nr:hypothetical protein [Candidatus Saccharibacteria bacterium]